MVCTLVSQTHLLTVAIESGGLLTVFPFFQASWIISSSLIGMVFYQQVRAVADRAVLVCAERAFAYIPIRGVSLCAFCVSLLVAC